MGRIFTFFHRDMGDGFTHEGHADCLCGPIRFSDDDMSTPAAMCTKLDQAERAMVN